MDSQSVPIFESVGDFIHIQHENLKVLIRKKQIHFVQVYDAYGVVYLHIKQDGDKKTLTLPFNNIEPLNGNNSSGASLYIVHLFYRAYREDEGDMNDSSAQRLGNMLFLKTMEGYMLLRLSNILRIKSIQGLKHGVDILMENYDPMQVNMLIEDDSQISTNTFLDKIKSCLLT